MNASLIGAGADPAKVQEATIAAQLCEAEIQAILEKYKLAPVIVITTMYLPQGLTGQSAEIRYAPVDQQVDG